MDDATKQKRREEYKARPDLREKARARAREWYENNKERAKARILAHHHATKKLKGGQCSGKEHVHWKGDSVGYHALHMWLNRQRGKPSKCEHCGTTAAKRFEWANVDHQYRRVLSDFLRLCTSCHRKHDYANGLSKKGGRRKQATTK